MSLATIYRLVLKLRLHLRVIGRLEYDEIDGFFELLDELLENLRLCRILIKMEEDEAERQLQNRIEEEEAEDEFNRQN